MVGMANSGLNTNGSQFFITYAPAAQLDGVYTIFGQVISGLDAAEKLTPRDPALGETLLPGDKILSVDIEEK
jgi:cyclophilin family peptidyl-prolyl cis-trans isomerase